MICVISFTNSKYDFICYKPHLYGENLKPLKLVEYYLLGVKELEVSGLQFYSPSLLLVEMVQVSFLQYTFSVSMTSFCVGIRAISTNRMEGNVQKWRVNKIKFIFLCSSATFHSWMCTLSCLPFSPSFCVEWEWVATVVVVQWFMILQQNKNGYLGAFTTDCSLEEANCSPYNLLESLGYGELEVRLFGNIDHWSKRKFEPLEKRWY